MASLPDNDRVVAVMQDLLDVAQSIASFKDRVRLIFDEDDAEKLVDMVKSPPFCAVQYEGMRRQEVQGATNKYGMSVILVASFLVVNHGDTIVTTDTKLPTILMLTALRDKMLGRKSPSGHHWEFLVEAAASTRKNRTFWAQRWQTVLQFQPRP